MSVLERARAFLTSRAQAYRATFNNATGEKVLADLHKFCRATEPTFDADPRTHALIEGRREVWLRIQRHLQMSERDLWAYHKVEKNDE